jgi:hypothetical protein
MMGGIQTDSAARGAQVIAERSRSRNRALSLRNILNLASRRMQKGLNMKHYYVDRNAANHEENGLEVHASWCPSLKNAQEKDYIGLFADPRKAVSVAQEKGFAHVCGCPMCCPETHRGAYRSATAP